MERRERIPTDRSNALLLAIQAGLDGFQPKIWTAIPAFVKSFNAAQVTVEAQPTIQVGVRQPDGTIVSTTLPLCVDCPVMFPGGGGFVLTFPVQANDEGLLIFSQRCIDSWWQNGGVQKQAEIRLHSLSDGFFLPTSGMSQPNVPANISTTSAMLRSKDGNTEIELAAGNVINVKATVCNFNCPVTFNDGVAFLSTVSGHVGGGGTVNFGNANLKTTGDLQLGDVASVNTHVHTEVQSGGDDSGPPAG